MSPRKSLSLLLAAAPPLALGAEPLYTDPVGFVKLGNISVESSSVPPRTDVHLTIPLERPIEFSGAVASTTSNTITVSGAPGWASNLWTPAPTNPTDSGLPYIAVITNGDENGIRALITSHTSDTLTVELLTPGDLENVAVGSKFVIRECWTLGSLVEAVAIPNGSKVLFWDETLTGINQVASTSYTYGAGNWYDKNGQLKNNVMIHAGETFVLRSGNSAIESFPIFGDVPKSSLRNSLVKDGADTEDLHVSLMKPVPSLLTDLAIPVENGDKLLVFDPNLVTGINAPASYSYTFGAGMWFDKNGQNVSSTAKIEPGVGYVIRRFKNSSAYAEWTEPAP